MTTRLIGRVCCRFLDMYRKYSIAVFVFMSMLCMCHHNQHVVCHQHRNHHQTYVFFVFTNSNEYILRIRIYSLSLHSPCHRMPAMHSIRRFLGIAVLFKLHQIQTHRKRIMQLAQIESQHGYTHKLIDITTVIRSSSFGLLTLMHRSQLLGDIHQNLGRPECRYPNERLARIGRQMEAQLV